MPATTERDPLLERAWRVHFDALDVPLSEANAATAAEVERVIEAQPVLPVAIGENLGAYRVEEILGCGGQAVVYLGRHALVDRTAALKVPLRAVSSRLMEEARSLAGLNHPHIVRMEDVVLDGERGFLVLEHLKGGTLAELLDESPRGLPEARVLAIARGIAEALAWAHGKGVVHRDLKPQNVLFDEHGTCKVADFGIGKAIGDVLLASLSRGTRTGSVGTPLYLAPEQALPELLAGGDLDGRADLFSLGKLLYHMLTGRRPLTVLPLSHLRPDLGLGWQELMYALLEEDRARRPASADEVLARLAALGAGAVAEDGEVPVAEAGPEGADAAEAKAADEVEADAEAADAATPGVDVTEPRPTSEAAEDATLPIPRTREMPVPRIDGPRLSFAGLAGFLLLPTMVFGLAGAALPVCVEADFRGSLMVVATGLVYGWLLSLAVLLEWGATRRVRIFSVGTQLGLLMLTAGVELFAFGFGDRSFRLEGGAYWALVVGLPLGTIGLFGLCLKMFLTPDLVRLIAARGEQTPKAGGGRFHLTVLAAGVLLIGLAFAFGGDLRPYSAGTARLNAIKQVLLTIGWTLFGTGLVLLNGWALERSLRGSVRVFGLALGGGITLIAISIALLGAGLGWRDVIQLLSGPSWALGIGLPLLINGVGLFIFQLVRLMHPALALHGSTRAATPLERARAYLRGVLRRGSAAP